jgi:hypothetical protein
MRDTFRPKIGAQKSYAPETCSTTVTTVSQAFADDVVVNAKELAHALRVSRWTVSRWREEGYVFEFGNRSTPGHLKAWLRERAVQGKTKVTELASKLARLR